MPALSAIPERICRGPSAGSTNVCAVRWHERSATWGHSLTETPKASIKIARVAWHAVPAPARVWLRGNTGRRLLRFAPAAVLALAATQTTYFVCFALLSLTAGVAGAVSWFAGAATSYLASRWAWERKGRPNLLKETLPFWLVSLCVGFLLTAASKFANHEAQVLGLQGAERIVFVQGLFLLANCVTFLIRFAIFHNTLFRERGADAPALATVDEA